MSLQDLYCLAYAPVQGTCLLDLEKDDICPELLTKELGFLERFTTTSFQGFNKYFEKADLATPEAAAALYCLSAFCNRLQTISLRAGTLAGELLQLSGVEYRDSIKKITAEAKANGLTPQDSRIEDLFDTEKDAEWDVPSPSKGRVDFRHSVSMIAHKDDDSGTETVHKPVKAEFTRKKVRKATGYAKFNFSAKDLEEEKKQDEESDASVPSAPPSQSSSMHERTPITRGRSTPTPANPANDAGGLPLLCFCCRPESSADTSSEIIRRASYVSMGSVQEIEDKDADVHWHDSERHSGRFNRIRGRIPTGHVSIMKSNSEEMLDQLLAEDTEEGRRARELLLRNTELNSASPPISHRSLTSEVVEPSAAAFVDDGDGENGTSHLTSPVRAQEHSTSSSRWSSPV